MVAHDIDFQSASNVYCPCNPQRGFFNQNMSLSQYIKETRVEMNHVNWPTRAETTRFTVLVIIVSVATAAILGLSDFVFSRLLTLLF